MGINDEMKSGPPVTTAFSGSNFAVRTPSYLGPGLRIKGQVTGNEDLRIDGRIEGPISLGDFRLTVGSTAQVNGEIAAREIVVYGEVKGNLRARDRLEIKKDSSVLGQLVTARITIEDGAYVKGTVEIERSNTQVSTDHDALLNLAEKDFKLKSARTSS